LNTNRGEERAVIDALRDSNWVFRKVRGISAATNLAEPRVKAILEDLYQRKCVRRRGPELWGLSDEEGAVRQALQNPRFTFRTILGIATATDFNVARVQQIINSLDNKNLVRLSYWSQRGAKDALWGSLERLRELKEKLDGLKEKLPPDALELGKATHTLAAAAEHKPRTALREYYDRAVEVARTTSGVVTTTGELATALLTAYRVVQLVAGWFGFPLPPITGGFEMRSILPRPRSTPAQLIRERAYSIWLAAGSPEGLEPEIWFQAVNDLTDRLSSAAPLAVDKKEIRTLTQAVNDLTVQLSSAAPLQVDKEEIRKLTALDRRISVGITTQGNHLAPVLLVERSDSTAAKKVEELSKLLGTSVTHRVTGVAYSSKVKGRSGADFDRPQIGCSIGHIRGYPGSVGCLAITERHHLNHFVLTSAAHVLSMMNQAQKGDSVIFPGHPDGPRVLANRVGPLDNFTFLNHYAAGEEDWANIFNHEDIASVKIETPADWPDGTFVPDPNEGPQKRIRSTITDDELFDYIGRNVFKYGRTTGLTRGTFDIGGIQQFPIRLPDGKMYMYRDMLAVRGDEGKVFSGPGDSGALIYTDDFRALGFVVGGSGGVENFTFACSAERSLSSIKARLA
jgi:hypothetical protein